MRQVSMEDMLDAREQRAARQREFIKEYHSPLISFTMNIPGPVKNTPLIRRAFAEGVKRLGDVISDGGSIVLSRWQDDGRPTGCEAIWAVEGDAIEIKRLCSAREGDALGRLFDFDVITPEGEAISREALGLPPRGCIVCGAEGRGCASRRLHSPEQLFAAAERLMEDFFAERDV